MASNNLTGIFMKALADGDFDYAYVTIIDLKDGTTLCEGIAKSLFTVVHQDELCVKSFKAYEVEDGSTLVDLYVQGIES